MIYNETEKNERIKKLLGTMLSMDTDTVSVIWNEQHQIKYVSNQVQTYFNLEADQLINENILVLFPTSFLNELINHFYYTSNRFVSPPIMIKHEVNNFTYFQITVVKVQLIESAYYLCKLKDVSNEFMLNTMLFESEKNALSPLVIAEYVHEIRNPLTSLRGFLQLIQAGISHPEKYSTVLLKEIDKIEQLTNNLLNKSKPIANERRVTSMNQLVEEVLLLFRVQQDMKNVQIEYTSQEKLSLYCNPIEIKQALINIVKNAAEAIDKKGTIFIYLYRIKDEMVVEVIDQGPGLSEHLINRMDQPFYTTKESGMGLGLTITKRIIHNHCGRLSAITIKDEKTIVSIRLPIHELN